MRFFREERLALFFMLACLVVAVLYRASVRLPRIFIASDDVPAKGSITVTIAGAVARPGKYSFRRGTSAIEAAAAAGPTGDAARGRLERSGPLADGEFLYVPGKGETPEELELRREAGLRGMRRPLQFVKINVNTASREVLQTIPGVGVKTAEAIIIERSKSPFSTPAELKRVAGIGKKNYRKIRDYITVR